MRTDQSDINIKILLLILFEFCTYSFVKLIIYNFIILCSQSILTESLHDSELDCLHPFALPIVIVLLILLLDANDAVVMLCSPFVLRV